MKRSIRFSRFLSCAVALLGIALAVCLPVWAAVDLDDIIKRLGDDDFDIRVKAMEDLQAALKNKALTADQLAKVRRVCAGDGAGTDPEVKYRCNLALKPFLKDLAKLKELLEKVNFYYEGESPVTYYFGDLKGQVSPLVKTEIEDFEKFKKLAEGIQQDLAVGDTASAKDKLTKLKDFINGLSADRFNGLFLKKNGALVTKQDVLDRIQAALDKIAAAEQEVTDAIGPKPAVVPKKLPLDKPGLASTGSSFALSLGTVAVPGEADMAFVVAGIDLASAPPDGFEFAGQPVNLIPDDQVRLYGTLTVAIEYGPETFASDARHSEIPDRWQLQMVRIANGRIDFLPTVSNDVIDGRFTASYDIDPEDPNPLGLFALVQPALEEPSGSGPAPGGDPWGLSPPE